MDARVEVDLEDENMSSEEDDISNSGNRVTTLEERNRRLAERRLIRQSNPINNIEAITQRLGRTAAQRVETMEESFRSMLQEERKSSSRRVITQRVDKECLRKVFEEDVFDLFEDSSVSLVKSIVNYIGPTGALLVIKLKNLEKSPVELQYKTLSRNKHTCLGVIIAKLFLQNEDENLFDNEVYEIMPKELGDKIKSKNYEMYELATIKLIL